MDLPTITSLDKIAIDADPAVEFWAGAEHRELVIAGCPVCGRLAHPADRVCANCGHRPLEPRAVPGGGWVVGHTVNHQAWPACPEPPYVVAIVALDVAPHVRLTTNLVGVRPAEIEDGTRTVEGLEVVVDFERRGELTVPVFSPRPGGGARSLDAVPLPVFNVRPPASPVKFEDTVAITGIGKSQVGRRLERDALELTLDACLAAIEDAGLAKDDIDGLSSYPGSSGTPGMSEGGVRAVEQALRLQPTWLHGSHETLGQAGAVVEAMLAVAAGLCRHVLCWTTVSNSTRPVDEALLRAGTGAGVTGLGELAWRFPYGSPAPVGWIALYASHYLARFGADRSFLGELAINARRNAARNPDAIYTAPMTMDDYLDARLISTPFGLFDCDVPCEGAVAFVVSAREAAADLSGEPVLVEAVGTQISEPQSWEGGTLSHQPNVFGSARQLWSRTEVRPEEVDVAELYDGFTFNCVSWIEGLGFCGIGEAPAFLAGGNAIGPDGSLPLNTHGGQLSAGRLNGYGGLYEAVLQLRGTAGPRQIAGARTAVTSSGGGMASSCMILRGEA